ncbi:MAG: hypothetical protein ACETV0_01695 [Nitrososphaeria archaeon]
MSRCGIFLASGKFLPRGLVALDTAALASGLREPCVATVSEGFHAVLGGPPGPGAKRGGEFACPVEGRGNRGTLAL